MLVPVAIGSALGGVSRYLLGVAIQTRAGGAFPLGTLMVNLSGSFLLGFLLQYAVSTPSVSPEARAFLTTGFCAGYTTFSTFSYEAIKLMEDGSYRSAAIYVVGTVLLALAGTFAGILLARAVLAVRRGV